MEREVMEEDKKENKKEDKKYDDCIGFLGMMATLDLLVIKQS